MKIIRSRLLCAAVLVCSLCADLSLALAADSIDGTFFAVLRSGDKRKLRDALDRGVNVNARDSAGNTPLMHAVVYGNLACVRLLLEHGADVNGTNAAGATALMRAAFDYEKLKLLVDHGADVKKRSGLGNTALLLAARHADSHRAVELLLAHGADAKDANQFGASALMAAAAGEDLESARLLIQHGANVNAQPTPDDMGFILGGGRSALMWAAFRGDVAMINLLLDAGADVNGMGGLGTPLAQAAWADQTAAAQVLLARGARVDLAGPRDGYNPLHWAASTEARDAALVKLLLSKGADANRGGGEPVDAFVGTPQTPLMLARRRGETPILATLLAAGATNGTADSLVQPAASRTAGPDIFDRTAIRAAIGRAVPPLQETSIKSKESFVRNGQDCTSCHQQYLPMGAVGFAKQQDVKVDESAERELLKLVLKGELVDSEVDWQPLFHPDAVHTKGYALFGLDGAHFAGDAATDKWVHHLASIQGPQGQWYNNLPRPPMQTGDIGATALAVHALQRYPLPGRKSELAKQVDRARRWLWSVKPENTEGRIYQILGLAWAGESARKLQPLARKLVAEQRADGGWAQLPGLSSDAYATGQAIFALRTAAAVPPSNTAVERGVRFLLQNQLDDGTWHVRRRAFPFQPTLKSGFPHGRDSWISAAASSWAVMALAVSAQDSQVAVSR